jgi:hypothetical protein
MTQIELYLDSLPRNIKFIDIYPDHSHYKLFFTNSFSLDPKKAKYIMTAGYKKTFEVFKKLEWD